MEKLKSCFPLNSLTILKIPESTNDINQIKEITNKFIDANLDLIISVGGGCVTDVAKVVCYHINNKNKDLIFKNGVNLLKIERNHVNKKTQHIAYITLPGSGAEASNTAVLNFNNFKKFIICKNFTPDHVVYMTDLFKNLDSKDVFYSLLDSFTHSLESLYSPLRTALSESYH